MKYTALTLAALGALCSLTACHTAKTSAIPTVRQAVEGKFLLGAALNKAVYEGLDPKADSIVALHYNQIVPENCMKSQEINPKEGVYLWAEADSFVNYGVKNNMAIIGHCLIWHSQLAPWFCFDSEGKYVTPEVLKERMRNHIHTMVKRYKGKIKGWDVVNEAIEDDGSYRKSHFYNILGEEFIPYAFQCAHEADPNVELYLNDYSMHLVPKVNTYVKIIKQLKDRGLRIDGIGMQSHIGLDYPDFDTYEKNLVTLGSTGAKVMITELDMTALPSGFHRGGANIADQAAFNAKYNPYTAGLPADVSKAWNDRMTKLFELYDRHADIIDRITFWGTEDGMSWRNGWPMRGRTDYALPFDRNYNMKPFLQDYIKKNTKK